MPARYLHIPVNDSIIQNMSVWSIFTLDIRNCLQDRKHHNDKVVGGYGQLKWMRKKWDVLQTLFKITRNGTISMFNDK